MGETTQTDKEALGRFLVRRLSEEDPTGAPLTVAELRRQLLPYPACREELDFASKAEYDETMLALVSDEDWLVIEDEALQEALEEELASPEPGLAFLGDFAPSFLHPGPRLTQEPLEDDLDFLESLDATEPDEPTEDAGETAEASANDQEETDEPTEDAEAGEEPAAAGREAAGEGEAEAPTEAVEGVSEGNASEEADGEEAFEVEPLESMAEEEPMTAATGAETGNGGEPPPAPTGSASAGSAEAAGDAPDFGGGTCWSCEAELPARPDLRYCPFCGSDQTAPECLECQAELELGWSYCPACGTATGRP